MRVRKGSWDECAGLKEQNVQGLGAMQACARKTVASVGDVAVWPEGGSRHRQSQKSHVGYMRDFNFIPEQMSQNGITSTDL